MADKFSIFILVLFNSWAMAAEALPNRFDYDQENGKVRFQIDELNIQEKEAFHKISVDGTGTTTVPGMPELPVFSTLYQINPEKEYSVSFEVIQSHTLNEIDIIPFQSLEPNSEENSNFEFFFRI